MFYQVLNLSTFIFVKPEDMHRIGGSDDNYIKVKVNEKVLGNCFKTIGYIVYVTSIVKREENETNAEILEDGRIKILVNFNCIAFLPYKNQLLDVIVSSAQQQKIIAKVGPCEVRINQQGIPKNWQYDGGQEYIVQQQEDTNNPLKVKIGTKIRIQVTEVTVNNTIIINGKMGGLGTGLIDEEQDVL